MPVSKTQLEASVALRSAGSNGRRREATMDGVIYCDSGKYLVRRAGEEAEAGRIGGLLLSAALTPRHRLNNTSQRANEQVERCIDAVGNHGVPAMVDAMTHIATFPTVALTETYDSWNLWRPGSFGRLGTQAQRRDHVSRVLAAQASVGVTGLAPTLCLESPTTARAQRVLSMVDIAMSTNREAWVTIAGTPSFWSSSALDLENYLDDVLAFAPQGFVLAVIRGTARYPVAGSSQEEVEGLARSIRRLAESAPVVVSHGDLAALPALAAGASGIGSGPDVRQRVLSPASFQPATGGSYTFRVTFQGLLSAFGRADSRRLFTADPAVAAALAPGPMPTNEKDAYRGHFATLGRLMTDLRTLPNARRRAYHLRGLYDAALPHWASLAIRPQMGRTEWIDPFRDGLGAYIAGEGW